jgi:hypothetical protein
MITRLLKCSLPGPISLLLAMAPGIASLAQAAPIAYDLVVFVDPRETNAAPISGLIGSHPFEKVVMTFLFSGDTANVIPFSQPVSGAENLLGTASVQINSATTGALVYRANFLPAAGIFVSVDNTNGGLGFGSFGALPSSPAFPGNPVYPYAANFIFGLTSSYDLLSYEYIELYNNVSCVGFPFSACSPGTPLPTDKGALVINPVSGDGFGLFFARQRAVPFRSFNAATSLTTSGVLKMRGGFALADGRRHVDPATAEVTLKIVDSSGASLPDLTIPPGSFQLRDRFYEFSGPVGATTLSMIIKRQEEEEDGGGLYRFEVTASGAPLSDPGAGHAPIAVTMIIGDDLGTTMATLPSLDHE